MTMTKVTRNYNWQRDWPVYRVEVHAPRYTGQYGLIARYERKWRAVISNEDGSRARYAGIWGTRREAVEEIEFLLGKEEAR